MVINIGVCAHDAHPFITGMCHSRRPRAGASSGRSVQGIMRVHHHPWLVLCIGGRHMRKSPIALIRPLRALGRHKIETLTIALLAALSAIGFARRETPAASRTPLTASVRLDAPRI